MDKSKYGILLKGSVLRPLKYITISVLIFVGIFVTPQYLISFYKPKMTFFNEYYEDDGILKVHNILETSEGITNYYFGSLVFFAVYFMIHLAFGYIGSMEKDIAFNYISFSNTLSYIVLQIMFNYLERTIITMGVVITYCIISPYIFTFILITIGFIFGKIFNSHKIKNE